MKDYKCHIFSPYRVCPLGAHVDHQHGLGGGNIRTRNRLRFYKTKQLKEFHESNE